MGITTQSVTVYSCERCKDHHRWIPRDWDQPREEQTLPLVCPKCKSPYWNRPRKTDDEEPKPAPKKAAKKRAKK